MMTMDFSLFEKVDINASARGLYNPATITAYKKTAKFVISRDLVEQLGIKAGDRCNLYRMGNTFAFKIEPVGCLTFKSNGNTTKSLQITNKNLWYETVPHTDEKEVYDAWAEQGVLFFRKK